MTYTQESFKQWLADIPTKMRVFIDDFAKNYGLKLDLSIASLDVLEKWILKHFDEASDLREEEDTLDQLSTYVGETFIKHSGGEWYVELENKKSVFFQQLVVRYKDGDGDTAYRSIRALCTTCITRNKGNLISSTLKKHL